MSPAAPGVTPTKLGALVDVYWSRRAHGWSVGQVRALAGDPTRPLADYTTPQLRALARRLRGGPRRPPRPVLAPSRGQALSEGRGTST